jgi:outer membrane protein assembly factor BamB
MRGTLVRLLAIIALLSACSTIPVRPDASGPSDLPVTDSPLAIVPPTPDVLTYRGDQARTGLMPGPGPAGEVGIRWTFHADGPIGSQVVVFDGQVDVVTTTGVVYALDLETGAALWQVSLDAGAHASPTIAGDLVIIAADDGVHALHSADGATAWTATGTGQVRGTPALTGRLAICMSTSGVATALDITTGATVWTKDLGEPDDTSVAVDAGISVIGLASGDVVALDVADGTERWRTNTGDRARIGTPTIADGRVFVVTLDGHDADGHHVAALELTTGRVLWRQPSPGGKPAYSPALSGGLAIVGSEARSVAALDVESGTVAWQAPAPGVVEVVTAVAGNTVYSASNGGVAFALDAANGSERWQVPIQGVPYGVAVTSGLVLVATSSGLLYAIGEMST